MEYQQVDINGIVETVVYDPFDCSHPREYWFSAYFAGRDLPNPEPPEAIWVCSLCGMEHCDRDRGQSSLDEMEWNHTEA